MTAPQKAASPARGTATTMKAAAIERFGPPEVLTPHTVPIPEVGPREVLIALQAAGVGVWDTGMRSGDWATGDEEFPLVLGVDGAGVVAARGSRVRRFQVDEPVWAYSYGNPKGGFYAEYVVVNVDRVGHVPRRLGLVEAGAGAVTGLTALQGVKQLRLSEGESVLIFGATGAVGTLAVQFAKQRGARVVATASGEEAAALVRKLGADEVIDARVDEEIEQLRTLAPEGLDAVLAFAGGDGLERCLGFVRSGGRLGYPNGVEPEPRSRQEVRVFGYDSQVDPRAFADLEQAADEVQLQVPIAEAFSLGEAARAHARLEEGRVLGRLILRITSTG